MTRDILIKAFKDAVETCGYSLRTGEEYRIGAEIRTFPLVWLITPELLKTEGIAEGIRHYKVEFKILDSGRNCTSEIKEQKWAKMEEDIATICLLLGADQRIKTITGMKYNTEEFSISNKGELSVSVSCTVQVPFHCHQKQ